MTTRPLIAVVDDDRIFTEMIRDFLDGEGYDSILIQEASAAVANITRAQPALVLLDIRMDAAESGRDILTALRADQRTANIAVIVCTADQQFLTERAAFLRAHGAATIAKPLDLDALLDLIQRALCEVQHEGNRQQGLGWMRPATRS